MAVAWIFLGLMGVGVVLAVMAGRDGPLSDRGSWLRFSRGDRMVFLSPLAASVPKYLGASLSVVGTVFLILLLRQNATTHPAEAAELNQLLGFPLLVAFGSALILLWMGGTRELELDLTRRMYRHTRRWLFGTQVQSGSFDDFTGVCATGQGSVLLLLKKPGTLTSGYALGSFRDGYEAAANAEQIAQATGLPLVASPYSRRN